MTNTGIVGDDLDLSMTSHNLDNHDAQHAKEAQQRKTDELGMVDTEHDKFVTLFRLMLVLVLVTSSVAVCLSAYYFTSGEETEQFENQFMSDAQKLFESVGKNFDLTLGASDAFIVKLVSEANGTWPFVTLPDWGIQAAKLLTLSKAIYFNFFYVVTKEQRLAWQNYTLEHDGWVEEAVEIQKTNPNYFGAITEDINTTEFIHDWSLLALPDNSTGPFMPGWVGYPVVGTHPYNWDPMTEQNDYSDFILESMSSKKVQLTDVYNFPDPISDPESEFFVADINGWASDFIREGEDPSEPIADIIYPVIDNIEQMQVDIDQQGLNVPAVMAFTFYWRDNLKDILPDTSNVIVVFDNTCGQLWTYAVDGSKPTYLGQGDKHDPKFDYLKQSALLSDLTGKDSLYTGLSLDNSVCPITLHAYPSQAAEDRFVSSNPVYFTVGAALLSAFTAAVFIIYDLCVHRRQRILKQRALDSGAIVSSLFPEKVRDQMYKEKEQERNEGKNAKSRMFASDAANTLTENSAGGELTGKPNAELYDETTVFFADLAGFTSWSSKRTPVEVFELLEAIYSRFDAVARRRKVFKVETIGDCYVAVTGIPEPQADHAVIMVKFARECMQEMISVLNGLAPKLGPDTLDLAMRVGMHSGSTTAGVLRGEKGRFQLFGDTVNTASRMESNGAKGCIHVSQATADKLPKNWVTAREDKIVAKGKGEMQTYFVSASRGAKSVKTSISFGGTESDDGIPDDDIQEQSPPGLEV